MYLITGLYVGGAETMLKRIVTHIDKDKSDILICTIVSGGEIYKELKDKGFNVTNLGFKGFSDIGVLFRLRKILKKVKPDILHCFMFHANMLGRLAAFGLDVKIISSVRAKHVGNWLFNTLDFLTQRMVDVYTPNSQSTKRFMISKGINKKKIKVIQNGLEKERFVRPKVNVKTLKESIEIRENYPILIMVANPRKQKDYPTMLKAVSIVMKKKKVHLLAVGGGTKFQDKTNNFKKFAGSLGIEDYVHFLGYRDDVPKLLAISDIWVSSTLYEGQSNALLEAMSMGVPIVTTNIPENAEVVEGGKEALLMPVKKPERLAEAVLRLLNDNVLARKISGDAFKKAKTTYSLDKTIKKTEDLYDKLIK